jgi:hypothetical protein
MLLRSLAANRLPAHLDHVAQLLVDHESPAHKLRAKGEVFHRKSRLPPPPPTVREYVGMKLPAENVPSTIPTFNIVLTMAKGTDLHSQLFI